MPEDLKFWTDLVNLLPTTGYRSLVWLLCLWTLFQPKTGFVWYFSPNAIAERRKEKEAAANEQRVFERRREDKFEALLREVLTVVSNNTATMQHLENTFTSRMDKFEARLNDLETCK